MDQGKDPPYIADPLSVDRHETILLMQPACKLPDINILIEGLLSRTHWLNHPEEVHDDRPASDTVEGGENQPTWAPALPPRRALYRHTRQLELPERRGGDPLVRLLPGLQRPETGLPLQPRRFPRRQGHGHGGDDAPRVGGEELGADPGHAAETPPPPAGRVDARGARSVTAVRARAAAHPTRS